MPSWEALGKIEATQPMSTDARHNRSCKGKIMFKHFIAQRSRDSTQSHWACLCYGHKLLKTHLLPTQCLVC